MTLKMTYDEAVERFESDVFSPVVPGEMERWLDDVSQSADEVHQASQLYLASLLADDYAEIAEADGEMFRRIDQLKEGDVNCQAELVRLMGRIADLQRLAPQCEPDELKMENPVESLVQQSADWVISAKRQGMARETWLNEAFNRDRGPVD